MTSKKGKTPVRKIPASKPAGNKTKVLVLPPKTKEVLLMTMGQKMELQQRVQEAMAKEAQVTSVFLEAQGIAEDSIENVELSKDQTQLIIHLK